MEAINFYIIHLTFLVIAEFIWCLFITFLGLKILRIKNLIFTKQFYIFVFIASSISIGINTGFQYGVEDAPIVSEIWSKIGYVEKTGIVMVPSFFLMYIYFYLSSGVFNLRAKETLFLTLLLGVATSPWRILIS